MKYPEPDPEWIKKPTATILFFPRNRIVRTILRGNKVFDPDGVHAAKDNSPKSA